MKITSARVITTCPGRNFVTLKIETEDGLTGIGDATLNGRELSVASYLEDHVVPLLVGRDAHRIEDIWQYLYRGAYWRRGPVTMTAIAAVDTALWDIKGKAAGLPVYQLLGGACRDGATVYGHANGETVEDTIGELVRYRDAGYKAVRIQCGVPGLNSTYGVSKDKMFYEPADADLPTENEWSTAGLSGDRTPAVRRGARGGGGRRASAARRASPADPDRGGPVRPRSGALRPFWLEDAVVAENQDNFRLVRHTTTPLQCGTPSS